MLLFHGTSADDEKLRAILREGLRAAPKEWAGHLIPDEDAFVFLSTSPVASKGGDPIAFARGWPWRGRRSADHARYAGYLFVVELPERSATVIHGAARNVDVEAYWQVRAFGHAVGRAATILRRGSMRMADVTTLQALRGVFALADERRAGLAEILRPRTISIAEGLVDGEVNPYELAVFGRAYTDAPDRKQKNALARRAGVSIPEEFSADSHYPYCRLCFAGQLYSFGYGFDGLPPIGNGDFVMDGQPFGEILGPGTMASFLETLRRWLGTYPAADVDRALATTPSWAKLQQALPPPRACVPPTFRPDFLTGYDPELLREADVQVLSGDIRAQHVIGAIRVTDGQRLRRELRPDRRRSETSLGLLWRLIHELRRGYRGAPVVL